MNKIFVSCLLLFRLPLCGQSFPRQEVDVQELLSQWALSASDDLNYEEIYENLYSLYQHPLDLNEADRDELTALFFLSEDQISALLQHRQQFGRYLSLYELQAVNTFTLEDVRRLLPFVMVKEGLGHLGPKSVWRRAAEHYLVLRADMTLERSRGVAEYLGTRQRYYTRYRMSRSKDFSVGFISEKDPGEKNFLDYTAFHIQLQNKGHLRNLVVGDYLLQFGQGMVFSAGYAAGKGGEPVYTTRRSNLGVKPYNSLVESGGFRGLATTWQWRQVEFTGMVSHKRKDASVKEGEFGSLLTAGMHRNEQEVNGRKAIAEQNLGGNVLYKADRLRLGFSVLVTRFDHDFRKRNLPYNFYEFRGRTNTLLSSDFSWIWHNFSFYGEVARSASGGLGYIGGVVGALGPKLEISINRRHYGVSFHTFYGSAFSEGSRTVNEQGTYVGAKYRVKKGWELTAYYDIFRFPWLKYRVDAPSSGQDFQVRINYKPTKKFSSWGAYRGDAKLRNSPGSATVTQELKTVRRQAGILSADYSPTFFLKFQSKIQFNTFRNGDMPAATGWALIQDVETRYRKMQFKMRVAGFRTDSYDSRVYAYENDVLYAVSFPAYFGRGLRWYAIIKLPLGNNLDLWLRAARTRVSDRETMGSGLDLIEGNKKTDVRLQVKYKL